MKRLRRGGCFFGAALALFGALVCCADGVQSNDVSLERSIALGLERSARVRLAELDREVARAQAMQSRALALPSLSLDARYTRLGDVPSIEMDGGSIDLGRRDNFEAGAGLDQMLYSAGKVRAALRAADLANEYAEWKRKRADQELVRDIRVSFFSLLLARETVSVQADTINQFEKVLDESERRLERGVVSEFDVLSARVRLANERPAQVRAEMSYRLGLRDLQRLLALDDPIAGVSGDLNPPSSPPPIRELLDAALDNRTDYQALRTVAELMEQDARSTRAERFPEFRGFANYTGANSQSFGPSDDDWEWRWQAGVYARWNLFDGGSTRAREIEKRLEKAKVLVQLEDLRRRVAIDVERAWEGLRLALESVSAAAGGIAEAEKALAIVRTAYAAGTATYLEVSDAALGLRLARLTYLNALRDACEADADLRLAGGESVDVVASGNALMRGDSSNR